MMPLLVVDCFCSLLLRKWLRSCPHPQHLGSLLYTSMSQGDKIQLLGGGWGWTRARSGRGEPPSCATGWGWHFWVREVSRVSAGGQARVTGPCSQGAGPSPRNPADAYLLKPAGVFWGPGAGCQLLNNFWCVTDPGCESCEVVKLEGACPPQRGKLRLSGFFHRYYKRLALSWIPRTQRRMCQSPRLQGPRSAGRDRPGPTTP